MRPFDEDHKRPNTTAIPDALTFVPIYTQPYVNTLSWAETYSRPDRAGK